MLLIFDIRALWPGPEPKGARGAVPPVKPECPPLEQKYYISGTVKRVNFRANELNFACVRQKKLTFIGCSMGPKYAKNALAAPGPTGVAHDATSVPDLLVGWGGEHQSQCPNPSAPSAPRFSRLWRFDPRHPVEAWCPADLELATVLALALSLQRQSNRMSTIKNSGLDQYHGKV